MSENDHWLNIELDEETCVIYYYIIYCNDHELMYIGQISRPDRRKIYNRHCGHLCGKQHVDKLLRTHRYSYGILWFGPVENVDVMEEYYISKYNTLYPNGLNHQTGGNVNKTFTDDVLRKMSENQSGEKSWRWGKTMPEWIRQKQSEGLIGKKFSEERKKALRKNAKGKKAVIQYSIKDGKRLKIFESIREASRCVDVAPVHIKQCCNGDVLSCKGYVWRWFNEYSDCEQVDIKKSPFSVKKIGQYDLEGNLINVYDGLREAAKSVGGSTGAICDVCNGKNKTSKGFVWKYI